jgi:uncharacterized LabA/DUF88 family protein
MVTKPTKEFTDAAGKRKIKGNMDLVGHRCRDDPHLDHMVLFSGDGDLPPDQQSAARHPHIGRQTIKSSPPMVADELRRQADNFIELADLAPLIARQGERPARPLNNRGVEEDDDIIQRA